MHAATKELLALEARELEADAWTSPALAGATELRLTGACGRVRGQIDGWRTLVLVTQRQDTLEHSRALLLVCVPTSAAAMATLECCKTAARASAVEAALKRALSASAAALERGTSGVQSNAG
jgi:hypothetical protein